MTSPRYPADFTRVFGTPPRHEEKTMRPATEKASREYIREVKMRDFAGALHGQLILSIEALGLARSLLAAHKVSSDSINVAINEDNALLSRIEAAMGDDFHSEHL